MRCVSRLVTALVLASCGPAVPPCPAREAPAPSTSASSATRGAELAACEPGKLGYLRGADAPPSGVVRDERDGADVIAASSGWQLPDGVSFALVDAPRVHDGLLTLRGALVNETSAPADVFLSEAGAGFFHATLAGDRLVRVAPPPRDPPSTPRPALFPEPHRFTLAPGARWPFELAIVLACWQLAPGQTVNVHWWLDVVTTPLQGDVAVTLP